MRRTLVVLLVGGFLAAACGGGGGDSSGNGASGAANSGGDGGAGSSKTYSYVNNGLEASFTVSGTSGTLEVRNNSGNEVGAPGLYSLDPSTGDRVDAMADGAAPIADGETASFRVTFPEGFDLAAAGFVGLELGGEDYGGFA
ncbi:MAG: hypothetical protein ACT4PO_15665 [Actinomycetota bacterium]